MITQINLGDLEDGQEWSDFLTVTLDRRSWHIVLAAIMQMGQALCEGIDDMSERAKKGDILATIMAHALMESNDDLRDVSLGIIQTVNPKMFEEVKAQAQANADA